MTLDVQFMTHYVQGRIMSQWALGPDNEKRPPHHLNKNDPYFRALYDISYPTLTLKNNIHNLWFWGHV